jgi:hypothetical protein
MKTHLNRRTFASLLALPVVLQTASWKSSLADAAPLAIKGYDTVAYFTDRKPIEGSPQYEAEWGQSSIPICECGTPRSLQVRSRSLRAAVRQCVHDYAIPRRLQRGRSASVGHT